MSFYSFSDNPCSGHASCLGNKLNRLAPLADEHFALLGKLEEEAVEIGRGEILFRQEEAVEKVIILKAGWVTSKTELPDGRSAISFIHYPGDIVGFEDLPFGRHNMTNTAASDLVCCELDRRDFEPMLERSPRLSALMMAYGAIEKAMVADRLAITRRRDGEARLALFLLQTISRLRLMNEHIYDQFHCPLNQQEIGEIVGITSIHVSRTFAKLEGMGLISRHKRFVRIRDEAGLAELANFSNRFEKIDLSWLPEH